jgi:hypothetical protein
MVDASLDGAMYDVLSLLAGAKMAGFSSLHTLMKGRI